LEPAACESWVGTGHNGHAARHPASLPSPAKGSSTHCVQMVTLHPWGGICSAYLFSTFRTCLLVIPKPTLREDQVGFSGVSASPIQPHFINWSGKAPYNENLYHLREARFDVSDARGRSPAGGYASSLEALIGSWLVRCANAVTRAQRSHTRPKPKACTSMCIRGKLEKW
jgi:hypothetical protein